MKFSVITPFHVYDAQREKWLVRAMNSVIYQTYSKWEHIVINDGSTYTPKIPLIERKTKTINQAHLERIIACNKGLKEAKGDWLVLLDSDDELVSYYLEACKHMITLYPSYKVFNFGSIHISVDYKARVRDAFKPKELEVGHEVFGGGTIVKGTYIFHRSCYEELGGFPEQWNPWDFSKEAQKEFPEIKPFFTVTSPEHPKGLHKELGNPWGDDYYLFLKLTRKYHSKPLDIHLYIVHPSRKEHKL